jgi:hypothetical protein
VADELVVRQVDAVESAAAAADLVAAWHEDGVDHTAMAVLARVNSALLPLQITFGERGIPGRQPIDESILRRTGIRSALAYLRIGLDPGRIAAEDASETIRRPSRRISRNVVDMLTKSRTTSVRDIRRLAGRLSGGDTPKLEAYADDLERVAKAVATGDTVAALRSVREDIDLGSAMDVLDAARSEADRSTHTDDLIALEQAAALHRDPATFEAWLHDVLRRRHDGPGVELSTIHRVKGREWDAVIVFGVDDGMLPHRLASDEEEERRLLHVAITRGRQRVVVMADRKAPSPFLDELAGTRSRERPKPRPAPASAAATARRTAAAAASATVQAEVGMAVSVGGHEGLIVEARDDAVLVSVGRARMSVAYGSEVVVDGRRARLMRTVDAGLHERLTEALRAWRTETAKRDGVSAFIVLNNRELDGIAERMPRTPTDLLACPGIGATRLERYGDELLSVIEGVLDA